MTELEIGKLVRNLTGNNSCKEEERSADDTGNNLGQEVRDILMALEAMKRSTILRKKSHY